jgi:hypothetical protein
MASPARPISIYSLERNKIYYVSHRGGPRVAAKVVADMHEELPGGFLPGGVMVVYSYQPYSGAAIREHDPEYRFFTSAGPKDFRAPTGPRPSPRRSSSARRSSERRRAATRKAVSRVRRTKSAPRH